METPYRTQDVTFEAHDGLPLAGTLFEHTSEAPRASLLISSGTGIPRRFYSRFAERAAERGFAALTYDYRGIGGSAPASLRGYEARYRDWGQLDIPSAIDWLSQRYPSLPLCAVGHSTGGQQLGLAPNVGRVRAALFITVSTGYWRGMPLNYRLFSLALWHAWVPLTSRLCGYTPVKVIRFGEDLPSGVAREWGAWCLEHDYMAAFFDDSGRRPSLDGKPFGPTYFDEAHFPIHAYYFSDDPISTRANAGPMLQLYSNADIETRWIAPADLGVPEIGHLGFFRSRIGQPLWDQALDGLIGHAGTSAQAVGQLA